MHPKWALAQETRIKFSTGTVKAHCFMSAPVTQGGPPGCVEIREAMITETWNASQRFPHLNETFGFGQRPRPLHSRHTQPCASVRWGMAVVQACGTCSRCKFKTVLLLKRPHNGRFNHETAVLRFQKHRRVV